MLPRKTRPSVVKVMQPSARRSMPWAKNTRLPIILRYFHGCSVEEIAQILKINEGTVCSRLSTAHAQLRVRLRPRKDQPARVG